MALSPIPKSTQPAFESEDAAVSVDDTSSLQAAVNAPQHVSASVVAPVAVLSTAIVASANTPKLTYRDRCSVIDSLQDAIPREDLEDMGYAVFPRVTVDLGGFTRGTPPVTLGNEIRFRVTSWNFIWQVSPGGGDENKEAGALVRSSYDNVTIPGEEMALAEYLSWVKTQPGCDKAKIKKRVEVYGRVQAYKNDGVWTNVPPTEQKINQLALSPSSLKNWSAYVFEARDNFINLGLVDGPVLSIKTSLGVNGTDRYGIANFSLFSG